MNNFLENRPAHGARNEVIPPPKAEPAFQPMFTGAQPHPEPAPVTKPETEAGPRVEFVQNGGKVERIVVTCTCCNRIELQCQY
jgi:hypothetical protein